MEELREYLEARYELIVREQEEARVNENQLHYNWCAAQKAEVENTAHRFDIVIYTTL